MAMLADVAPDAVLLTGFDWDLRLAAAGALAVRLRAAGADYPHMLALRPNSGMATGHDMDGDGRRGGPRDAQGYGRFAGAEGMLLLSRLPLGPAQDFSAMLWTELPGALLPEVDGRPFPSAEALAAQRLSSTGHWVVPLQLPGGGVLQLLCYAAGPPVFDGPEDRNGRRNHDETMLWVHYLDGALARPPPEAPVVVLGNANLDPQDGDGRSSAMRRLLSHPRLQDPAPSSPEGAAAARSQGGENAGQSGDPARDTADWSDTPPGPGNLRVDYVLPDARLTVTGAGVRWPPRELAGMLRHGLVWVDVVGR